MAITLVALQSFSYNQRQISPGSVFDACSDHDAVLLKAMGRAKDYEPKQAPTPHLRVEEPVTERAHVEPAEDGPYGPPDEPTGESACPPEQPRKKRTYKRRDLTAESE